jgi:hypothetical protein
MRVRLDHKYAIQYVADTSIPPSEEPSSDQFDNQRFRTFKWWIAMMWFCTFDPEARASVKAGRIRFITVTED